jgi:hypothetical protein
MKYTATVMTIHGETFTFDCAIWEVAGGVLSVQISEDGASAKYKVWPLSFLAEITVKEITA